MTVREALEDGCRRLKKTVCGTDGDGDMGPFGMGAAVLSPDDVIVRLPGQQVFFCFFFLFVYYCYLLLLLFVICYLLFGYGAFWYGCCCFVS